MVKRKKTAKRRLTGGQKHTKLSQTHHLVAKRIKMKGESLNNALKRADLIIRNAPKYDPNLWNSDKYLRNPHNCYTYFLNKIKPELSQECKKLDCKMRNILKPQPGYHAGCPRINDKKKYTCEKMVNRTLKDNPYIQHAKDMSCPDGYYMGALAVHPGLTYHYYRRDNDGYWSHKDGATDAQYIDADGKKILDPEKANRSYPHRQIDGIPVNYSDFCGHFCIPKDQRMKWWQSGPKDGHVLSTKKTRDSEKKRRGPSTRGRCGGRKKASHPSNYNYGITYSSQMTPSERREVKKKRTCRRKNKRRRRTRRTK